MTKENIETKLEKIKNCFIKSLPNTPDYNIKIKAREDIGKNVYEVNWYDPMTGWGSNSYGRTHFIVYSNKKDDVTVQIDGPLKQLNLTESIVDLLERIEN